MVLRQLLVHRLRMLHIYRPVLLKALLLGNGRASLRDIAAAFLALDEAQLEYYEEITERMPGTVLSGYGFGRMGSQRLPPERTYMNGWC